MAPHTFKEKKEEQAVSLEPQVAEGICSIFISFSDSFVYVTDVSGKETIC